MRAIDKNKPVPPEVLADYTDLAKPSPSVVKPEEPLKPTDLGYASDRAFERDYKANSLKEYKETRDEFLKRRHCSGTIPVATKASKAYKKREWIGP